MNHNRLVIKNDMADVYSGEKPAIVELCRSNGIPSDEVWQAATAQAKKFGKSIHEISRQERRIHFKLPFGWRDVAPTVETARSPELPDAEIAA